MFIRAYLRASTADQDAERAKEQLVTFAREHGHQIASFYVENESGATLARPELMRLIRDAVTFRRRMHGMSKADCTCQPSLG